ncbi:four-helix bundle copper-binding protein [Arthrobacter halodurans]|uniref:Four-helix bundle copper-binding protein n=1 Tax=Arthrobacter halodurans TaxID=516699 RepID=A0ABV4UTG5_9MICC
MTWTRRVLAAHPSAPEGDPDDRLADGACIEACLAAAQACLTGADACLQEDEALDLRACIRVQQNCADVCLATAAVLSRTGSEAGPLIAALVEACTEAVRECEAVCARHAETYRHCVLSAEACLRCERACTELIRAWAT